MTEIVYCAQCERIKDVDEDCPYLSCNPERDQREMGAAAMYEALHEMRTTLHATTARAEREGERARQLYEALRLVEFPLMMPDPDHLQFHGQRFECIECGGTKNDGHAQGCPIGDALSLSPDADARASARDAVIAAARAVLSEASSPHSRTPYTAQMVALENAVAALDGAAGTGETNNGD